MAGAFGVLQAFRVVVVDPRSQKNWFLWFAFVILPFALPSALTWGQQNPSPQPTPRPSIVISLSETSYREPSRRERLVGDVNGSLHFIDDTHVLLTFDPRELFQRNPDCSNEHDDRLMRAVILEVPGGKVVNEATWYLHDRRRYVWPIGSGEFLLRRLNTLYLVNSSLQEKMLFESPSEMLWISVTPDHEQIIVEAQEHPPQASSEPVAKNNKDTFVLQFLDTKTLSSQRTIRLRNVVNLEGTGTGYADSLHKGDLWLIRYGPSPQERRNIARVRARDTPRVLYSSSNSLLIGRCCSADDDYSVTSFSLSGHRLWRSHWPRYRFLPLIAHSRDGSRFAISTVRANPETLEKPASEDDDSDADAGLEQNVQVIESATGSLLMSLWVKPIVISEENFSLSPDGRRLAVLSGKTIQIYDLPVISLDEQAKLAALKADIPELSAPVSDSDLEEAPVSAEGADQGRTQAPAAEASVPGDALQSAGETSATTFRAATRVVVLDIVVTDTKGHPRKGLRKEDFKVAEDDTPQDIRSFRETSAPQSLPIQDPPAKLEKQTPKKHTLNVFTNVSQSSQPASVMMILLDVLNTPITDQRFARQELVKFLDARATNTSQVALSVLTGDQNSPLKLIQGFTPDENLLLTALNKKKGASAATRWQVAGESTLNSLRTVREHTHGDSPTDGWQALLHGLEASREVETSVDLDARVRTTTGAMIQLANYLAGIPGRKSLVWLSGSFPIALYMGNSQTLSAGNRNYRQTVEQISNLLAKSQVAVYPVDVHGLDAATSMSAGVSTFISAVPTAPKTNTTPFSDDNAISPYQEQTLNEMSGRLNEHVALERIASATGGKAFYNANAIKDAISTATEQAENYYSISYSPSNKDYNGRFRKIKITLADKQLHLYYRPGYFADDRTSPENVARNIRIVAMQHGSPQSRQIRFSVRVAPAGVKNTVPREQAGAIIPASRKTTSSALIEVQRHTVDYAINYSDLRFIQTDNGLHRSSLSFMIASFDSEGRPLTGIADTSSRDLKPETYREVSVGGVRVHQEVDVPTAASSLRIGVQDQLTGYIGTVDIPLPVPPPRDLPRIVKHQLPEIEPD